MDAHATRSLLAALIAVAAGGAPAGAAGAADDGQAPARLRDTGLYSRWESRQVSPDNLPFAPQYPLWSDGARKRRWIHIPAGAWIDASDPDAWVFPVGTRLWKEFSFGRRVETRYMQRLDDGSWLYATYVWTDDGADALLAPERGLVSDVEVRPGVRHALPGTGDCRACHEGKVTPVLGFDALQLSPARDPLAPHAEPLPPGAVDLRVLVERGLVRGLPARLIAQPPRIAAPSPTARAALGYLHGNCGGCHNPSGPLGSLGLALSYSLGAAPGAPPAAVSTTVGQAARFHMAGPDGADLPRLAPGRPEGSLLALRMRSRQPLAQMPPLGTRVADDEALALLDRWIAGDLHPAPGLAPLSPHSPDIRKNDNRNLTKENAP